MSENIEITTFSPSMDLSRLEEIFFITASIQNFSSEETRARFKYKYLSSYMEKFPDFVLVALKAGRILGYCLGAPKTDESFYALQPHLELFNDLYERFPAHLHINLHPEAQGLGIGQKLFTAWEGLVCNKVIGLHIMTGPESRNVSFYRRLGLSTEEVRKYQGHDILFMGKNF